MGQEVERALRFAQADGLPSSPLTLIEAPAGFGKTTLARQWWANLKGRGVAVAWLSFTEAAACDGGPALNCLSAIMEDAFEASGSGSAEFPALRGDRVLFLNDIHHAAPAIVPAILSFLRGSTPGLHIVATSRKQLSPDFRAAGLGNQMTVRRWADLAYSTDDLQSFLSGNSASETVDTLLYRLKGWPALVQLLHGIARHWPGAVLDLAVDHASVADAHYYFIEEVYCDLDDRDRAVFNLAMDSSHLTPTAVEDMLGLADATTLLTRLEQHYGLLEAHKGIYRVHEVIRSLTRYIGTAGDADTHRRIANRFEQKGDLTQAVFHAVEARDGDYAADLLRRAGGWNTALEIGAGTLDRLCAMFTTLQPDPQFTVAQTYVQLQSGRIREARESVDRLKQALYLGKVSAASRAEWLVLHMLVAHYQNRMITPDLVDRLGKEMADEPRVNHRVLIVLDTHFRAYAYFDVGDYGKCLHWLQEATRRAEDTGLYFAQIYALVFGSLANFRLGRLTAAVACLRQAEHVAGQRLNGIDLQRHQSMIQIFDVLLAWEMSDERLTMAEIAAIEGRMLAGCDGWPPILLCFYLCTSEMIADQQGLASALTHLDRGLALARREDWRRVVAELTVRKIFLCLEAGALDQAGELFATLDPAIIEAPIDPHLVALVRLAKAWQALAEDFEHDALAILEPLNHTLSLSGASSNLVLGYALAALAKERQGDVPAARALIAEATGPNQIRYRSRWFRRLRPMVGTGISDIWPSSEIYAGPCAQSGQTDHGLTDREWQTLKLVADGFCVKGIARLLDIKPSTVASYRKQGYRKLGISKRSELHNSDRLDQFRPGEFV